MRTMRTGETQREIVGWYNCHKTSPRLTKPGIFDKIFLFWMHLLTLSKPSIPIPCCHKTLIKHLQGESWPRITTPIQPNINLVLESRIQLLNSSITHGFFPSLPNWKEVKVVNNIQNYLTPTAKPCMYISVPSPTQYFSSSDLLVVASCWFVLVTLSGFLVVEALHCQEHVASMSCSKWSELCQETQPRPCSRPPAAPPCSTARPPRWHTRTGPGKHSQLTWLEESDLTTEQSAGSSKQFIQQ